jgi:dynein heavy chain 2, cytosolic
MTSKVSDNAALVASLKESRYVGKFQEQVEGYDKKIGKIERALFSLQLVQRRWIYLEPILVGGALPDQLDRFLKLDSAFKNIMRALE